VQKYVTNLPEDLQKSASVLEQEGKTVVWVAQGRGGMGRGGEGWEGGRARRGQQRGRKGAVRGDKIGGAVISERRRGGKTGRGKARPERRKEKT
jgi:hypothetical protein